VNLSAQIRQGERSFVSDTRVRAGHEASTPVEINLQIGGIESDRVSLESEAVKGQEWRCIECRPQGIERRRKQRRALCLFVDRLGGLFERRFDVVGIRVVPRHCRAMLETQFAARPEDQHATQLPSIALHGCLARPTSQSTNRISDQLRRRHLATPTPKLRRSVGMQVRVDEQMTFDFELFAKGLREAAITVPDDHHFDAPISPCLHRVTQLRNLLTAEESTKVTQEDQNDDTVLPEVAQADG
jgi:hypothetical protein